MKNQSKFARFLNGKGFYIALGICMLAIGVSAWTAIDRVGGDDITAQNSSQKSYTVVSKINSVVVNDGEDDKIQSQPDSISNQSSKVADEQTVAAPVAKYFLYPINGEVIKGFSDSKLQYSLTYNDMRLHKGIDIKGSAGTAVKSAGDGVVLSAERDSALGYTVKIDHGNGVVGVYSGLNKKMSVKKGDEVKAGTTLAALGEVPTECLDAPHLHLEFYKNDKAIDPMSLITNN